MTVDLTRKLLGESSDSRAVQTLSAVRVSKTFHRLEVKYVTCFILVITLMEAKILCRCVEIGRTHRTDSRTGHWRPYLSDQSWLIYQHRLVNGQSRHLKVLIN